MAYQETDSITAEAEASDAIDDAIEEAIAHSRDQEERQRKRASVGRWIGRISLLSSLVLFGIGAKVHSKPFALAGTVMLILAGGIALMRLGGGISVQAKGEQARETSGVSSFRG